MDSSLAQNWESILLIWGLGLLVGFVLKVIIFKNITKQDEIPLLYPIVVILNSLLYVAVFIRYGFSVETIGFTILGSILLLIAFIDFKTMLIPNWTLFFILLAGLIFAFFSQEISWLERFIGFFSASGILLLICILSKGGLGGGDIKLMAAVGFYLGWKLTLLSLFCGVVLGGLIGIVLLISGKGKPKTEIPFGPFLVFGIITTILFGDFMIDYYLSLVIR